MNEFNYIIDGKPNLDLRHIVRWEEKSHGSSDPFVEFMIYQTMNGSIGMVNVQTGVCYQKEFSNLAELEKHLEKIETKNNLISIEDEWIAYTP